MKKRQQKTFLISYIIFSISIVIFSIFLLYKTGTISIMSSLLATLLCAFLITIFGYLFSKNIKLIKIQWFIAIALCISTIFVLQNNATPKNNEKQYLGLDISRWNGDVDLKSITSEIDFVIIRCGYTSNIDGTTHKIDDQFNKNLQQCIDLNIPYGIYYYSLANTPALSKSEAEYTLSLLGDVIAPLGVYIDVEDESYLGHLNKKEMTDIVLAYTTVISNSGNQVGVYANYYWWENKLDHGALSSHYKWLALYDDDYEIEDPYYIHQYTNEGVLEGLPGTYDLNIIKEKFW